MSTKNQNSTTETPSSQGGVISRSSWSLEEIRYLFDCLEKIPNEYGRYVRAAKMIRSRFGNMRTPAACRCIHRRMIIRP